MESQTTSQVMMVRPAAFTFNPETARTNAFQSPVGEHAEREVRECARLEFDRMVEVLEEAGLSVHVFEDTETPPKPDAVFPNNWVSFHACGRALLYPLESPSRRAEVRPEWIEEAARRCGTRWETVDLSVLHDGGAFLEGTGSLVLDRTNRLAFACLSPRTTEEGLEAFSREMGYEVLRFRAVDRSGLAIYHTNVLMGVGTDYALVCLEAIPASSERRAVQSRLEETGHEVVAITIDQMECFAGNSLALRSREGVPLTVMSTRAAGSLSREQLQRIEAYSSLIHTPLATIEDHGGGSARCMLAEIHVPSASPG